MPEYFNEDRFRPSAELYQAISSNTYIPQTHALDPESGAVKIQEPTFSQFSAANSGNLLEMFEDTAKWYIDLRSNQRVVDLDATISSQLPAGKEYTMVIVDPGGYNGPERVDLYTANGAPPYLSTPYDRIIYRNVTGSNPTAQPGDLVQYNNDQGQPVNVEMPSTNNSVYNPPPPLYIPPERPNTVDREPGRIDAGPPERLPPDSRFDHDYPNHLDPSGLA